jgi:hypothetical protein
MNDSNRFSLETSRDNEWAARLSRLRPLPLPRGGEFDSQEAFPSRLAERARNRSGPVRFAAGRFAGFWETLLISSIFLLLAWDLFRAIRLLLR